MALDVNADFQVDNVTGTVAVVDLTMPVSSTNTGGYGAPNIEIADVTDAAVAITLPDTTTFMPTGSEVIFDGASSPAAFPTLPNTSYAPFVVDGEMVGEAAGDKMPDGVYKFGYQVTDGTNTYSSTKYVLIDSTVRCCLSALAQNVDVNKCKCGKSDSFSEGWYMLEVAQAAMECQNITVAAKALVRAKELCNGCGCS